MGITGERTVDVVTRTLGERIVEAARLAVSVHLFESLAASSQHYGQHLAIGGAGPFAPATADHSRRPSIFFPGAGRHSDADADGRAGPK